MSQKRGKICLVTEKPFTEAKGQMSKVENKTYSHPPKILIELEISGCDGNPDGHSPSKLPLPFVLCLLSFR